MLKKFRPQLIPTIFTVLAVILLLTLGTWQLYRMQWKNNLIAAVDSKMSLPVEELPAKIDNIDDIMYRRFTVSGHYLNDQEIHLFTGPRAVRGTPGYDIITPLKRDDGSIVLVDRGWVPNDKKSSDTRPETLVTTGVTVEGMLHKGETPGRFTPENDPEKNLWFWIDTKAISQKIEQPVGDFYLRRIKKDDDADLPIGGDMAVSYRNDHLQYAITWYLLAFIAIVIYVLYHYRKEK